MLSLAWRNVRENPTRFALTALAITLGVAFYVATTVLTATVDEGLSGAVDKQYAGIDAGIRSDELSEGVFIDVRSPVDAAVLDQVAAVEGVGAVSPSMSGYTQLVGRDGKAVSNAADVVVWSASDDLNQFVLVEGRAPQSPTEVVVNVSALEDGGLQVGNSVRLLPQTEAGFTIVGAIDSRSGSDIEGRTSLGLTFDGAADVFQSADIATILVAASSGTDNADLVEQLRSELGAGLEVVPGQTLADEAAEQLNSLVSIISTFLTSFAGVAVFVSVFVIYNTFSITVSQRQKEMATLRAIGATPKQVLRSVLVESLAVGVVAALLGVLLGVILGAVMLQVLAAFGFSLGASTVTVNTSNLIIGFLVGLGVTIVSAYFPARRGASVPPIEALRDTAIETVTGSALRSRIGFALLILGGILATVGAGNLNYFIGGAGIVLLFGGVIVAAPAIAPTLAAFIATPLRKTRGIVGEVATENSTRNPKRTATTALALMIGVTLVVTASVVAASLKQSIRGDLEAGLVAELVIEAGAGRRGGLSPTTTASLLDISGVDAVSPIRPVSAVVDDLAISLTGAYGDQLTALTDVGLTQGDIAELGAGTIAISTDEAEQRELSIGDSLSFDLGNGATDLEVIAIYENTSVVGGLLVDTAVSDLTTRQVLDPVVLVRASDTDVATVDLNTALAGDPTAEVKTADTFIDEQAGTLDTLLNILYGLLGLSVLIALLGVTNTMSLSIFERTRELGLMRAVGMTGPQLRSAVRYESGIVALVGTIGGLALGGFFGWLVQRMASATFPVFDIPWTTLAAVAIAGVLAGVLAGWRPAIRASQLNVLDAISH